MASEKVAHAGACELVPDVELGLLVDGQVNIVQARQIFARKKSFVIGVPGAYTPICSKLHVPELVRDANRLRRAGYDLIACIASNDPFVLQRWAQDLDPQNKVTFLSDGNLEFARALDLVHQVPDLFIGARSERYSLVLDGGTIKRLRVERSVFDVSCSSSKVALDEARETSEKVFV